MDQMRSLFYHYVFKIINQRQIQNNGHLSKLQKVQAGQSFNSLGKSEIPEIVITELLVNALIHRNYFIHDSIKLFVFENRIEIRLLPSILGLRLKIIELLLWIAAQRVLQADCHGA